MDPLSITVSCLTLIGVASKTSVAITTFIRGCRAARSDLTSISGELTQLQLVLELLKDDTDVTDDRIIPQSLQAQILSIIANCSDVVDKVNKVLQKFATKTGPAKWTTYGKTEVDGLRMSLEAHRGSLSLVLELVSVSLSKAIKEDTAATRTDVHDIKQDTSQIPHIMAELAELRVVVAAGGQNYILEQYLDSLTSYAETVCHDVAWDSDGSMHIPLARVSPTSSPKPTPKPTPKPRSENLDQPQEIRELPEPKELRLDSTQGSAETPPEQSRVSSTGLETPGNYEEEFEVSEPTHDPTSSVSTTEASHPEPGDRPGASSNSAIPRASLRPPPPPPKFQLQANSKPCLLANEAPEEPGLSSEAASTSYSPPVKTFSRIVELEPEGTGTASWLIDSPPSLASPSNVKVLSWVPSTAVTLPPHTPDGPRPTSLHPQSPGELNWREPRPRRKLVVIGDRVGKTSLIMCVYPFPVPCLPLPATDALCCRTVPLPRNVFQK